jgi:lipoate-protein ligase A
MAVDEAILEAAGRGDSPPTLRLYAWEPACLSLGYAQHYSDVDLERLRSYGWDVVRRPTGGRAILHTDELTYAVIGPPDEPRLVGSVLESYRRLSGALLQALHDLKIPAEVNEEPAVGVKSRMKGPVCFEVPSNYEITVGGKKLIGSAQARRKDGVLQHGSLPLYGDQARITWVLVFPEEAQRQAAAQRVYARAATAQDALGNPLAWETAAQAFITAFCQTLDLELRPGEITPAEMARAGELLETKYNHPSWTERI